MSDSFSPLLGITELNPSQSQPEIPVNEAVRTLEAFAQLAVKSKTVTAPPGSPADGDRYIVPPSATGAWAGKEEDVVLWMKTEWIFFAPKGGWIAYVESSDSYVRYSAVGSPPTGWVAFP